MIFLLFGSAVLAIYWWRERKLGPRGSLSIVSFSEHYDSIEDVEEDVSLRAILSIEPEIDGKNLIITDDSGSFTTEVPEGQYKIKPLYASSRYEVLIDVEADSETEAIVKIPLMGVFYYKFNCEKNNPPFNDVNVRNAFSQIIDREEVSTEVISLIDRDAGIKPAYNFIHYDLSEDWADEALKVEYSEENAKSLVQEVDPFSFTMLLNVRTGQAQPYSIISPYLEKLDCVEKIKINGEKWEKFQESLSSSDFEFTREWWFLDSNNLLEFFKVLVAEGNEQKYNNEEFVNLFEDADEALNEGDIKLYEEKLVSINDIIIEDAPVVPIYFYNSDF